MDKRKLAYRILQIIFAIAILLSAVAKLTKNEQLVTAFSQLGYPIYLMYILGIAYFLGIVGIFQSKSLIIREWAYAGFSFALMGAILSHTLSGDPFTKAIPALILLAIMTGAYIMGKSSQN